MPARRMDPAVGVVEDLDGLRVELADVGVLVRPAHLGIYLPRFIQGDQRDGGGQTAAVVSSSITAPKPESPPAEQVRRPLTDQSSAQLRSATKICGTFGESNQTINAPTWTSPIRSSIGSHRFYLFAQVRALLLIVVEVAGIEPFDQPSGRECE